MIGRKKYYIIEFLLERMTILGLLNSLQDILVETEGEGASQDDQSRVRDDGHDRNDRKWQEDGQNGSKDDAALAGIAPVDQIRNCW